MKSLLTVLEMLESWVRHLFSLRISSFNYLTRWQSDDDFLFFLNLFYGWTIFFLLEKLFQVALVRMKKKKNICGGKGSGDNRCDNRFSPIKIALAHASRVLSVTKFFSSQLSCLRAPAQPNNFFN